MMIGGEFNTPADWLRAGNAVKTIDDFAASHGGNAPVFVFVDSGGAFNNDTECVNGTRGNAADHLTKDVVPFMESHFGVSAQSANWGVVGWSMGGTCAVDLAVMHPDMFSAFEDIAGDLAPTRAPNPRPSSDCSEATRPRTRRSTRRTSSPGMDPTAASPDGSTSTAPSGTAKPNEQAVAASSLCALGRRSGIDCAVVSQKGSHDWPFASNAFASALPWLASTIGTPGVPHVGLPAPPQAVPVVATAAR